MERNKTSGFAHH